MLGTKRRADDNFTRSSKKIKAESKSSASAEPKKKFFYEDEEEQDADAYRKENDAFDEYRFSDEREEKAIKPKKGRVPSKDKVGNSRTFTGKLEAEKQKDHTHRGEGLKEGTSSREAHAEQKRLAMQRKAAKPNADSIERSKRIWERLRIKSAVPKDEREKLVKELFDIIHGRVKDFVFKHDSVRVIQCALKYATSAQKKSIAQELRGSYKELAESRYAKFLVAKLVMLGDDVRDWVVEEFYGHVKRLIRHPEAGWIVDDIYRGAATKAQKAKLLREWYGPEFVVMKISGDVTCDLQKILKDSPEKRGPIMMHLKEMTNQLVQKKTTGFTMLHDALLQYFLNCNTGSAEQAEFLDMLKDDEEGDLFKNLAFTKSGSRLVCLALAHGNAKDRRTILKFFKTHIKLLAADANGCRVILTAYAVIDDTVMTAKAIFPELLNKDMEQEAKEQELLTQATNLVARVSLLFLMSPTTPKWLITDAETAILDEVREIRKETSKKDPEKRRTELVEAQSQPLLDLIVSQLPKLTQSSFGSQYITEVLFGAVGEKQTALEAVAGLSDDESGLLNEAHVGRMLKSLVQGGPFDKKTKSIALVNPPLDFDELLYQRITATGKIVEWAQGANSFVILAMLESATFEHRDELSAHLKANVSKINSENAGSRLILEKLGTPSSKPTKEVKAKEKKEKKHKSPSS